MPTQILKAAGSLGNRRPVPDRYPPQHDVSFRNTSEPFTSTFHDLDMFGSVHIVSQSLEITPYRHIDEQRRFDRRFQVGDIQLSEFKFQHQRSPMATFACRSPSGSLMGEADKGIEENYRRPGLAPSGLQARYWPGVAA